MNYSMTDEHLEEIRRIHRLGGDEDVDHDTRAHCHRGELIEEVLRLRAQEPTTVIGLPVFCDFCDCADCQGGREGLTHAATADGRWICDVCYIYDLCTGANKQVSRAEQPCEDKNCAHRPQLISAFVPKLFPVDQEITPGVWATRWHAMKEEPTPAPLDDEERAELAALRLYDQSCAGGDRPMSPAAGKLKRLMELEAREKVKG